MENCPGETFKKLTETQHSFDKNTESGSLAYLGIGNQETNTNLYTKDSPKEGYDSILSSRTPNMDKIAMFNLNNKLSKQKNQLVPISTRSLTSSSRYLKHNSIMDESTVMKQL